jgi:hypothetical protein
VTVYYVIFFENYRSNTNNWATFFNGKNNVLFITKMGYIWAIFSYTHLVTLADRYLHTKLLEVNIFLLYFTRKNVSIMLALGLNCGLKVKTWQFPGNESAPQKMSKKIKKMSKKKKKKCRKRKKNDKSRDSKNRPKPRSRCSGWVFKRKNRKCRKTEKNAFFPPQGVLADTRVTRLGEFSPIV